MRFAVRSTRAASIGLALSLGATLIWNYPTIAVLAPHLADKMGMPLSGNGERPDAASGDAADDELLAILGEVDKASEDNLRRMLVAEPTTGEGTH